MPEFQPPKSGESLANASFARSAEAIKAMDGKEGARRAAQTALEIFRNKARLGIFVGVTAVALWPTLVMYFKFKDQDAQANPPQLKGDSFLSQLKNKGAFRISDPNGSMHASKYVNVSGYATLTEEKVTGTDRFGEVKTRWYIFEPLSTNMALVDNFEISNQSVLNSNLFPSSSMRPPAGSPQILVSAFMDSRGELTGENEQVEIPKDGRKFPVTLTLSKSKGYFRTRQSDEIGGLTNSAGHYFRALAVVWGLGKEQPYSGGQTNLTVTQTLPK